MSRESTRAIKKSVRELLSQQDLEEAIGQLYKIELRRVINPLFSFFYSGDELLRWRSITAAGAVMAKMADNNMEDARVMMRRLIWNLNDESGGIGWGSPEAMGEAMARSSKIAGEYARILVSYLDPEGNFLEHEVLQRGVLWGIGRVADSRVSLVSGAGPFLDRFMESGDPIHRGLAAWCACSISQITELTIPEHIMKDKTIIRFYHNNEFHDLPVYQLSTGSIGQ